MNGNEFIRLAGLLVARFGSDEAALRTAVSRAYYGAFHLASDLLRRLGVTVLNHGSVRQCLKESGVAAAVGAGRLLDDLQGDRVKADYRLDSPFTAQIALLNVERAHQVRSFLAAFDQEDAAAGLQSGLKEYIRRIGR